MKIATLVLICSREGPRGQLGGMLGRCAARARIVSKQPLRPRARILSRSSAVEEMSPGVDEETQWLPGL